MLIGITGKIGSGKTTVSEILKKMGYEEYSFAAPIKKIAEIFGFTHKSLYTSQEEKAKVDVNWNVSSRTFLQLFGTEIRKEIETTIPLKIKYGLWVDLFLHTYDKNKNYVFSDVRFPHEAQMIRDNGGIIIRTIRDCETDEQYARHPSEVEMENIKVDYVIDNNILNLQQIEQLFLDILKFRTYSH